MNKVGLSLSILSLCWFISIDGWAGEFYSNNSNTLSQKPTAQPGSTTPPTSSTTPSTVPPTPSSDNSNTPSSGSGGSWGVGKFYSNNSNTLSQKPTPQPAPPASTTSSTDSTTPSTGSTTSQSSSSCVSQKITTTDSNGNVTTTDVPCNNQPSNESQGSYGHGTNY